MYPARSLIAFTTLSGLGLGLLFWLGVDQTPPRGWVALVFFGLAFMLTGAGLAASASHLGRPDRAPKAFSQWRSSWLSREAWAVTATLIIMGLHAAFLVFADVAILPLGWLGAMLALGTVVTTAMIYTQLKTVPRWYTAWTPALFVVLALAGGALLSGRVMFAMVLLVVAGGVQAWWWRTGDQRIVTSGTTLASATGLGSIGTPRAFEPPHTGPNYLLREMVYVVGRKHARKLRLIALVLMMVLPVLLLQLPFPHVFGLLAVMCHIAGVTVARWLFFAEAEHVVGLYYGQR